MGPAGPTPWALPPSATTTIVNGQSGVVSFDVTADIAAWRAGTLSAGWLVKRVDEGPSGAVEFGSRESEAAPRLVLALVGTPLDTIPPPIPDGFIAPDSAVALLVSPPGDDSVLILRNFVEIVFHDTTSGPTVLDVFARYGAQVAGGYPRLRGYIVQVPDPGPTYTALDSLLALLRSEPAIRNALQYVFSEPYRNPGRYPDDDSQLRGMRAPLARGCERGLYGPDTVVVCVVDTAADTGRPAVPNGFAPPDSSQALFFALPGDTRVLILRDFIHLEFDDSTAGTRVHSILQEYSAEVAGGFPSTGTYVVRIPDPGPSYSSLESIMAAIRLESGVRGVYRYVYQEPIRNPARFPRDGGAAHRSDRPSSTGALAHRARGGARPAVLVRPQAPFERAAPLTADTYLRQGEPNQNFGTASILRVRPTGDHRALLRVDAVTLAATIGDATVAAARLELTITLNANNWGPSGREIALHRLTVPWTETGATWHCGVDSVPGNSQAECAAGTAWAMGPAGPTPWATPPTATTTIVNGQSGVVSFDVTADIAAWRAGSLNAGWLVKRVDEGPSGAVEFGSRESEVASPLLVLTVAGADTSRPAVPNGFAIPDGVALLLEPAPNDTGVLVLRDFVTLEFWDTTTGPRVLEVLNQYSARVVGGYARAGVYVVQIPDPGTYQALDSLLAALRSEPGVRTALRVVFTEPARDPARFPVDSLSAHRQHWLGSSGTDGTQALRAIRALLAWGCETGAPRAQEGRHATLGLDGSFGTGEPGDGGES
jgi:hypothetical protein